MLLFIISLLLTFAGFGLHMIKGKIYMRFKVDLDTLAFVVVCLGTIGSCVFSFGIIATRATMNEDIAAYQERQAILEYQRDNELYTYGFTQDAMRDYVKDVEEWNTAIAKNRKYHDNPWYGQIFFPIDYYQFDLIELPPIEPGVG